MMMASASAGPVGAIGAGFASQAVLTGLESMIVRKFRPFGFVKYLNEFAYTKAGDHVENIADLVGSLVGGHYMRALKM